jgi:hypothetical protein
VSYLKGCTNLPDLTSAIISFWVKVGKVTPKPDPWNAEWQPMKIEAIMTGRDIAFTGGSYWNAFPQFVNPRVIVFPPGGNDYAPGDGKTLKDGIVPFMTFGDPGLKYDRITWKKKNLGNYFYIGPGIGTRSVISQVPESLAAEAGTPAPPTGGTGGTAPSTRESGPSTREGEPAPAPAPVPLPPSDSGPAAGTGEGDVVPPSMIGIRNGHLCIHLQTNEKPKMKGYAWAQNEGKKVTVLVPVGSMVLGENTLVHQATMAYVDVTTTGWPILGGITNPSYAGFAFFYEDVSLLECAAHPEAFVMDATDAKLNDGKWHHVLLSFNLAGTAKAKAIGDVPWDCRGGKDWNKQPYGQYSGRNGEMHLELGLYGEPYEECGDFGWGDFDGEISSTCKAWLYVDGKKLDGKNLNHHEAWSILKAKKGMKRPGPPPPGLFGPWPEENGKTGEALLEGLDKNAILPPSAFLAPFKEIRDNMTTSLTLWERWYRTALGGFTGPGAKIQGEGERRRLDHDLPEYEFTPTGLPTAGHPICIPSADSFKVPTFGDGGSGGAGGEGGAGGAGGGGGGEGALAMNQNIILAELQIWANPGETEIDDGVVELFIRENAKGEKVPQVMRKAAERFGKPQVKLHGTSNWKKGYNTGDLGVRIIGEGTPDQKREKIEEGQLKPEGQIDRYKPDPKLEAEPEGGGGAPPAGGGAPP